jgi:hypothetical protein
VRDAWIDDPEGVNAGRNPQKVDSSSINVSAAMAHQNAKGAGCRSE